MTTKSMLKNTPESAEEVVEYDMPLNVNQWWDLVWFVPATQPKPNGWMLLNNHTCGGFSCNGFSGWVLPANAVGHDKLLRSIADEDWCTRGTKLDYEVKPEDVEKYRRFLIGNGLVAGDIALLTQAVYPIAATEVVFARLGLQSPIGIDCSLLVLGQNCD